MAVNKLKDIAQLVGLMEDKHAKLYVVQRWWSVKEIAHSKDEKKIRGFIEAILTEKIDRIAKYI